MRWIDRARKALADLFRRDRFEREMDEELRGFLDLAAEDRERHGATSAEAYRTEHARFGGVEACKDSLRDARVGATVESIARDIRISARSLLRHPGFSTAAILTIALGIFPLTAVVGLANGLFFHPAPGVTAADRLVRVRFLARDATGDIDNARLSYGTERDLAKGLSSLTALAGRFSGSASIIAPDADGLHVDVDFVTHDYFRVLGMRMGAGRVFTPEEDREPGGSPVAILGHRLASTLFDTADRAPGRTVLINGLTFTVVGVTPPDFRGLKNDHYSQVWIPGATSLRVWHTSQERWEGLGIRKEFIGRLAANVELEQARAELTAATRALAVTDVRVERQPGMSFSSGNTESEVALMVTLFASAGALLLLLAAANVGNLWLFRGARRREEIGVRSALGASRWQLLRAHLIEVSLISLSGGAVGLVLTFWLAQALKGTVIPEAGFATLPTDWRVAGLVLAGSVLIGLVFGGAPSIQRRDHRRGRRLRNSLTVMQLALSLSLLVGAILLLMTVRNLVKVDIGFDPAGITSAQVNPIDNGYDDARSLAYYRALLERAVAMPAVSGVSVSLAAPVVGSNFVERVALSGDQARSVAAVSNGVTADYFRVLGVRLLRGRGFSQEETFARPDGACGPVVVSESLALRLFGTRDALNRVLVIPRTRPPIECNVVGVAADVRMRGPAAEWALILYRPLGRSPLLRGRATILARSDGPAQASTALRDAAASIDPALPLFGPSLAESIEFQMAGPRIISSVLGLLAFLGLSMAGVGLYGLVAETVVDRRRELAVRIAVGAGRRSIVFSVVRRAIVLAGIGIAAGAALSVGLSRAIRSQLFGVTQIEPWVYLAAAGLLAAVVVSASLAPAIRATRMNPVDALRSE